MDSEEVFVEEIDDPEEDASDDLSTDESEDHLASGPTNALTPEGFIMLTLAGVVDILDIIPGVGTVVDIIALVIFGLWMYFRSGTVTTPKKSAKNAQKVLQWAKKQKWLRPVCMVVEMVPVFSGFLPLWIAVVYLELQEQ